MNNPLPNRQSIRMKGWDYSSPGRYFVTINTKSGRAFFGTLVNGQMVLNAVGKTAEACWLEIPQHFPEICLDEFVIMPNHVHGIIHIKTRANHHSPISGDRPRGTSLTLGSVVRGFKIGVAKGTGLSNLWHRNYWDVIIRDATALANIRRYIRDNPRNYERVLKCGEPRMLGNPDLLKLPKVGFVASRGETESGVLTLKKGEVILSGFLSPMERRIFRAALSVGKPMIWVKPWGLGESLPEEITRSITAGKLLILSPFDDSIDAPSAKRAVWYNEYVVAHSDRLVVGCLNPSGLLACVLSEVPAEVEIVWL